MKVSFACILFFIVAGCASKKQIGVSSKTTSANANTDVKAIPIGDINFDKIQDTAFVAGPKYLGDDKLYGDCQNGSCSIDVYFSGGQPTLHFENAVSSQIENIGDIDDDGFAELLIAPSWWMGCRGHIHVYSFKNGNWKHYGYAENNVCGRDTLAEFILQRNGNTLTLEELVWDAQLEDNVEKPKAFIIE